MSNHQPIEWVIEEITRLFGRIYREGGRLGDPPGRALTSTQVLALQAVVADGPLRIGALAERLNTTDATATRTVDALEAAGLARREAEPSDRRGILVTATSRGQAVYAERRRRMRLIMEGLLERTPEPELLRIAEFLRELNELLEPRDATTTRSAKTARRRTPSELS